MSRPIARCLHFLLLTAVLLQIPSGFATEKRAISGAAAATAGSCSPGILAGDFLYVSGQSARGIDGKLPSTPEQQVRQSLENVRAVMRAAGLSMEHVVYAQVYLTAAINHHQMNRVWKEMFAGSPVARATLIVSRIAPETPIAISAVAVRDLSRKKVILPSAAPDADVDPPSVLAGDRLYVSGYLGRDPATGKIPEDPGEQVQLAFDRVKTVLTAAGIDFRHLVFVNPYLTSKMPVEIMNRVYVRHFDFGIAPARATIHVTGLPDGADVELTGVAAGKLSQRSIVRPKNRPRRDVVSPCVFAGDTLYCSAKSGSISGPQGGIYASTVEHQLRQSMRNLLDGLEEAGLDFSNVVAADVYLDDLDDFTRVNRIYGQYFPDLPPTCTVVQQIAPVERKSRDGERWPALEQVSLIAVK